MIRNNQYISIQELSELLGLPSGTLNVHLARFGKYGIENKGQYYYRFNMSFLQALKDYYVKRMQDRHGQYAVKYFKVAFKLDELLKEKAAKG